MQSKLAKYQQQTHIRSFKKDWVEIGQPTQGHLTKWLENLFICSAKEKRNIYNNSN